MIFLLAHNRRHCQFFNALSNEFKGNYSVATSYPSLDKVDFDIYKMIESSEDNGNDYEFLVKKYDVNFNKFHEYDRSFSYYPALLKKTPMTLDRKKNYIVKLIKTFEKIIESGKIKVIFSELIIGLFDAVFHAVALKKGVPYIGIRQSKLKDGFVLVDPYTEDPIVLNPHVEGTLKDAELYINKESSTHNLPSYMRHSKKKVNLLNKTILSNLRFLGSTIQDSYVRKYYLNKINYRLFRLINTYKTRARKVQSLFINILPDNVDYYIYPLQFEPEATVMVRGYPFSDQLALIDRLARQLPKGTVLVVKEHFGNEGYRKINDYYRLASIPNVVLLGRGFSVDTLISGSKGVITISGRMGYEAICRNIPVCCLGYPFWRKISHYQYDAQKSLSTFLDVFFKDRKIVKEDDLLTETFSYLRCVHKGTFLMLDDDVLSVTNLGDFHSVLNNWSLNAL